jgi:hypothetical protein
MSILRKVTSGVERYIKECQFLSAYHPMYELHGATRKGFL